MSEELVEQQQYWDSEIKNFDAIYSHKKSKLANKLDAIFRSDMYERFNYTLRNAMPIQNRSFLDVGCGTGYYSLELARRKAQHVVGVDISEKMINVSRQRADGENLAHMTSFIQTDLLEYETSAKFDVSIGIGLFDYVKDPLPLLQKMRKSSDKAIMSFPRLWTWRAPIRKIRLGLRGCKVYFYTSLDIEKLLTEAGFESFDMEKVGKLFCVTAFVE